MDIICHEYENTSNFKNYRTWYDYNTTYKINNKTDFKSKERISVLKMSTSHGRYNNMLLLSNFGDVLICIV